MKPPDWPHTPTQRAAPSESLATGQRVSDAELTTIVIIVPTNVARFFFQSGPYILSLLIVAYFLQEDVGLWEIYPMRNFTVFAPCILLNC